MKYDVIVIGASVGGCTAAALYARQGLSVALLERSNDFANYKKICTHYLQPRAIDTLRKLGLDELIEAAGGRRNDLEVWTEWGWIKGGDPGAPGHGYNIRRETLDPILRRMAAETPGVTFRAGVSISALIRDARGRVGGVVVEGRSGREEYHAPLVVAADGRDSRTAGLAGVPARVHENDRFTYFTYYRGLPLSTGVSSQYWHLHPSLCFGFRNDDDTTLLGIVVPKNELSMFKADPMGNFRRFWDRVPDAPAIGAAQPICELRGITDIANRWRPASAPGIAFVGDAAMVMDPIWGTGCCFAFLSADWLVAHTADAFGAGKDQLRAIDRGLERYRKYHRSQSRGHYLHIASLSRLRGFNPIETLVFSAATRDTAMANRILTYLARTVGPSHLVTPAALWRASLVNLRALLHGRNGRDPRAFSFGGVGLSPFQRASALARAIPGRG